MSNLTEFHIQKFRTALGILSNCLEPAEQVIVTDELFDQELVETSNIDSTPIIADTHDLDRPNQNEHLKVGDYFSHIPWTIPSQEAAPTDLLHAVEQAESSNQKIVSVLDVTPDVLLNNSPSGEFFRNMPWLAELSMATELTSTDEHSVSGVQDKQVDVTLTSVLPSGAYFRHLPWLKDSATDAALMSAATSLHIAPGSQNNVSVVDGDADNIILAATESALKTAEQATKVTQRLSTTKNFFESLPWAGNL